MSKDNIKVHTGVLYPVVRVRSKKSGGSGTVIWSDLVDDEYHTFVLTNHHVIKDLITVEDKYNPFVQRHIPTETRGTAHVERFRYQRGSRIEGTFSVTPICSAMFSAMVVLPIEGRPATTMRVEGCSPPVRSSSS